MSKVITTLVLLFFCSFAFAESIVYRSDIKPKHYNKIWKKQFDTDLTILYESSSDSFGFLVSDSIYTAGVYLDRNQTDKMIQLLEKYENWKQKAVKKQVKLEKDIGTFSTKFVLWKSSSSEMKGGKGVDVRVIFFSQSTNLHQLVIVFPKFQDVTSAYSTHQMDDLYFNFDEAVALKNALKKESVKAFLKEYKKQQEIESEFK